MNFFTRFLALLLCSLTLAGTASASQEEELENLRRRIAAMQSEIVKTSETKNEAADALRVSERAISDRNRKLFIIANKQTEANRKLSSLEMQHKNLTQTISSQQVLLGKLLYQRHIDGRHDYLKLMLDNQNPNQVARDLQYYQYIARNRAAWLEALRSNLNSLKRISLEVQTQSEDLNKLRLTQAAEKKELQKVRLERKLILGQVSKRLGTQRKEFKRLQRNENRLSSLVEKIAKMLAKKQSSTLFKNNNLPDNRFDGKPFAQLKGRLRLPVRGDITNRFGTKRPDSTLVWKGLFIRTSSGNAVKAIASGRVVFADWLRGFGNLIIVDHGNAYMSLYGNNETMYKQVGDELKGGDTIAAVGNSGGIAESGLYFELRHQSKPLDPLKWLAKNNLR